MVGLTHWLISMITIFTLWALQINLLANWNTPLESCWWKKEKKENYHLKILLLKTDFKLCSPQSHWCIPRHIISRLLQIFFQPTAPSSTLWRRLDGMFWCFRPLQAICPVEPDCLTALALWRKWGWGGPLGPLQGTQPSQSKWSPDPQQISNGF